MIRFYCRTLPTSEPQLGFDYLSAIDRAKLKVLACPLSPALLGQAPWSALAHLFIPMEMQSKLFLNMVCAPPNFLLGGVISQKMIAPDPRIASERSLAGDDAVYHPLKAVIGLYTDGVPNVAVVAPQAVSLEEDELEALRRYDLVLCPSEAGAKVLSGLGVTSVWAPPEPEPLAKLLAPLIP